MVVFIGHSGFSFHVQRRKMGLVTAKYEWLAGWARNMYSKIPTLFMREDFNDEIPDAFTLCNWSSTLPVHYQIEFP